MNGSVIGGVSSYISVFSFVWFGLQVWTRGMMNKSFLGKGFKALSFGAYGSFHFIILLLFCVFLQCGKFI